ncbi:hypothetical protein DB30_04229 [Enhygromyxa salina]|uniref:Uncharacterized protein n=1 Tax=Enhygromyxa salina TaxID=215803 RepID=A0A0C2D4K4_9BACT|nr:hypothetical protein DB30_04229 [Enhygromyxa salina]
MPNTDRASLFSEDSMRGVVTVRVLDNDPKQGKIFVAR